MLFTKRRCEGCGCKLDRFGDHLAACMRTGRVQARAKPVEHVWARVFREVGATTHEQHLLRNTTLPITLPDNRRIDILVTGSSLSRPLFCDTTLRSPLTGKREAHPRAAHEDEAILTRAVQNKTSKYADIEESSLAELVVLAGEIGGRWNDEACDWLRYFAELKGKQHHPLLRRSLQSAWLDRWWTQIGVVTQNAFAASLLAPDERNLVLDDTGI